MKEYFIFLIQGSILAIEYLVRTYVFQQPPPKVEKSLFFAINYYEFVLTFLEFVQ